MAFTRYIPPEEYGGITTPPHNERIWMAFEAPDHKTADRFDHLLHHGGDTDGIHAGAFGIIVLTTADQNVFFTSEVHWSPKLGDKGDKWICWLDKPKALRMKMGAREAAGANSTALMKLEPGAIALRSDPREYDYEYVGGNRALGFEGIPVAGTNVFTPIKDPQTLAEVDNAADFILQTSRQGVLRLMVEDGVLPTRIAKDAGYMPAAARISQRTGTATPKLLGK